MGVWVQYRTASSSEQLTIRTDYSTPHHYNYCCGDAAKCRKAASLSPQQRRQAPAGGQHHHQPPQAQAPQQHRNGGMLGVGQSDEEAQLQAALAASLTPQHPSARQHRPPQQQPVHASPTTASAQEQEELQLQQALLASVSAPPPRPPTVGCDFVCFPAIFRSRAALNRHVLCAP